MRPTRVALALSAAAVLLVLTSPPQAAAQELVEGSLTTSDGVRIHYYDMGEGTPVVLIHGFTANAHGKWIKPGIAASLAADHRVVAIDARGHGMSDKPHEPTAYGPRMAEDVIEVMDALEIDRAHVHGYSMGGSLLTQVLKRHPERVITAVYGGSGVTEVDPAWLARVPQDPDAPEGAGAGAPPSEAWSAYPGYDREALAAVRAYPWTTEERAIDLAAVDVPVLAIVGEFDGPNRRTHRMARELERFELVVLPGDTHGSAHFNPRYTEALADFIRRNDPWFGIPLPPPFTPHTLQVLEERAAAPARVPVEERAYDELVGDNIRTDLETIVSFARQSRSEREVGEGQIWGRITGFPSGARTVDWAVDELRRAGIERVELQTFGQDEGASIWLPLSWEVRLLGSDAFASAGADVVLESAMPLSAGELPAGGLEAPLVYVGTASAAELAHIDVRGRVAVQKVIPQGHTVFVRNPVGPRSQALFERGALAVLNVVDLPGNMRTRDIGCGGGACFNLGGRDGRFLESVLDSAALAGSTDELRVRIALESDRFRSLSAANGVATVPGTTRPNEYVVVNAHADSWFDGAGDNGDGLAVMVALARHFARDDVDTERSLVFVASAGHHSSGLSGPRNFVAMNPDIVERTVLVINLEHTSQRHIAPARSNHADGYREWTMDAHEAPIVAGVSNQAPFLDRLVEEGLARYGTNFVSGRNPMASGEGGTFRRAGIPVFTTMQGPPMYHTTGEVAEMVSTPGLERMARFMAWFIKEVSRAEASDIDPM